jgi:hypothetical protein
MAQDTLLELEPVQEAVLRELRNQGHSPIELLKILTDNGHSPSEIKTVIAELLHDGQLELSPDRVLTPAA